MENKNNLPCNIEAEQAVLGAILIADKTIIDDINISTDLVIRLFIKQC